MDKQEWRLQLLIQPEPQQRHKWRCTIEANYCQTKILHHW